VLARLIERKIPLPPKARILEVGCGTGHNLTMLERFGSVEGIEIDAEARAHAEKRLGRAVASAPLPELPEIPRSSYDLVAALDVVEHIEDDQAAIAGLASCIRPGGRLLVTVPAHQWMWSAHDELNHHKRRYSKHGLARLIDSSPLRLESIGYFNSLLFPLAVGARLASRITGGSGGDDRLPPAPVNYAFERVFAAERRLIGTVPLPPGLSLFAVAAAT
jgi:SAM-dependent methyltransferase